MSKRPPAEKGSILVLVMWVLALLAIFSQAIGFSVRQQIRLLGRLERGDELREIADAGIQKGLTLLNRKEKAPFLVDALKDSWSDNPAEFKEVRVGRGRFTVGHQLAGGSVRYGMMDEESKIHLNATKSASVFSRLIQSAVSLSAEEAMAAAHSILDWRDEDDNPYEDGAESRSYGLLDPPYASKNRDFDSLEELQLVKGITPELYQSLVPYLTLYGAGHLNVNTASAVALTAFGLQPSLVEKIISFRAGPDQTEGTGDDRMFPYVSSIAADLNQITNLADTEQANLESFTGLGALTVSSKFFTITSTARLDERSESLTVTCVAQRWQGIRSCKERYSNTQNT